MLLRINSELADCPWTFIKCDQWSRSAIVPIDPSDIVGFFPCRLSLFPVAYSPFVLFLQLCKYSTWRYYLLNGIRRTGLTTVLQGDSHWSSTADRAVGEHEFVARNSDRESGNTLAKSLSVSALPLLYHSWKTLIAEFAQFLSLTHLIFAEEEETWWECYRNTLFTFIQPCLTESVERELTPSLRVYVVYALYTYKHRHTHSCSFAHAHHAHALINPNNYSQFNHCCIKLEAKLFVAMDITACLEDYVKISKIITDGGSSDIEWTWFSEVVFLKMRFSKPF